MKSRTLFATIQTEGAILPADLLQRISAGDKDLGGLTPNDYHLYEGEKVNEAINRSWNRLLAAWSAFRNALEKLSPTDITATTVTREKWLLILFQELGYGRLSAQKSAITIEEKSYPISHLWQNVPIHLVGARIELDRRTPGVTGASKASPHGMLQELLNRSSNYLWAFLSNGLKLRLLRDNISLTRNAFVEFDLEAMMKGEVYADFALLWLLAHQSRIEAERPEEFWLEKWSRKAAEQGKRALDQLRNGVEKAISALGSGFLSHPQNRDLKEQLQLGKLSTQEYYRQLLRLVYRLLFLFVAEDRELLLDPDADNVSKERYRKHYSTARIRRLAEKTLGTRHSDLFVVLKLVMDKLNNGGCVELALPPLGSFLFSKRAIESIDNCQIANSYLLKAINSLAFTSDGESRRPVDYKNMRSEELGSVYESLLELHPMLNFAAGIFSLETVSGSERKTTGSYYTPESLVQALLDSALDPVLNDAAKRPNPEDAILNLKVCDPACGSGHFLVAAAHRIAKRLASVRTGDEEPSPEMIQKALRDVIGRCIYGVDLNEMAVELCKVALWMEAIEPGKPLTFLEHHIQCGNSLFGATPALIDRGITDEIFKPIEGDDKHVVSSLKKGNQRQRLGQTTLFLMFEASEIVSGHQEKLSDYIDTINKIADDKIAGQKQKDAKYQDYLSSNEYKRSKLIFNAWCAAFVWKKKKGAPLAITEEVFQTLANSPEQVPEEVFTELERLEQQYKFFHWNLAFPDVFRRGETNNLQPERSLSGWVGGFDVVLGNPPWDQIQLDPQEFFAFSAPNIANAQHMTARNEEIKKLELLDPILYQAYMEETRKIQGIQHFIHNSFYYPLTSYGRLNSAPLFCELSCKLISQSGKLGFILPTGIATDSFNQYFFQNLLEKGILESLYDFENKDIFPNIHRSYKFCLITLTGFSTIPKSSQANTSFVFFASSVSDLNKEKIITLSREDIYLLNPNTKTCPIFRTKKDAKITKEIYKRVPVLVNEGTKSDPWHFQGLLMFMMNTSSKFFLTRKQLKSKECKLKGNIFYKGQSRYLPLYEAKMVHQFDHRWATYEDLETKDVTDEEKNNPNFSVLPRYWVPEEEVNKQLNNRWNRGWLLGWRDVTNNTNERTVIAGIIPRVGVGHQFPLFLTEYILPRKFLCLYANITSFALDYVARQKIGGTHLTYFYLKQFPVFPPEVYDTAPEWLRTELLSSWILPRVLELTYTSNDLAEFALDCGYEGSPFKWNEERRFLIRCELDAAFFHLYGISRDDVDYIMETFPIIKRRDEASFNEYRTKQIILEIYDAMAEAMKNSSSYQSIVSPPPADLSVAHPPKPGSSTVLPFRRVEPSPKERFDKCVPLFSLKAAASAFGEIQEVEPEDWVEIKTNKKLRPGMFVAQVVGQSMEPLIPDGSYCLFSSPVIGSRQGRVVLVQHHSISDPETGGKYTVKRYSSNKVTGEDGQWQHIEIVLDPINPQFSPIILVEDPEDEVRVIAEFVEVLKSS